MIKMEIDKKQSRKLQRLAATFPRETYRGIGRAMASVRGKMRKVMRSGGGVEGVPKFAERDPDTEELAEFFDRDSRKTGGELAKTHAIQIYRNGKGNVEVGFLSALAAYARSFQTEDNHPLSEAEKRLFRVAGVDSELYTRPARPVIEPFSKAIRGEIVRMSLGAVEKILKKNASK